MGAAPKLIPDLPTEWTPDIPAKPNLQVYSPSDPLSAPDAPMMPVPEAPGVVTVGGLAALIVLLTPTETAPAWMDELNPVTGKPYSGQKEYDDLWRNGREYVAKRVAESRLQQAIAARRAAANLSDNEPLSYVQRCPHPVSAEPVSLDQARVRWPTSVAWPQPDKGPLKDGVIKLKCDPNWNDCQKRQAREKIRRLSTLANRAGGLRRTQVAGRAGGKIGDLHKAWTGRFRRAFNALVLKKRKSTLEMRDPMDPDPQIVYDPTGEQVDFMDDCLYEEWKRAQQAGKGTSKSSPLDKCDLDHVQDKQWGGIVKGPLVWLDAAVNRELGRQMNDGDNAEIDVAKDFELECP